MNNHNLLHITDNFLQGGCLFLQQHIKQTLPQCWLAIAKLTIALQILAEKLRDAVYNSMDFNNPANYLFEEAEKYCTIVEINDTKTASGPLWYLVRYIVRKFGSTALLKILESDYFKWILPSEDYREVSVSYTMLIMNNIVGRRVHGYCCCI